MTIDRHEFGNVLGIVIGNAQLLMDDEIDAGAKELVADILDAATRMRTMMLPSASLQGVVQADAC